MGGIDQFAFERIANSLFLHHVNIKRFHGQSHCCADIEAIVIMHQQFISVLRQYRQLIMHPLEDHRLDFTAEHAV